MATATLSSTTQDTAGEILKPTLEQVRALYQLPFFDLIQRGRNVYLRHWQSNEIQLCKLLSIKTGGCSEDCAYCAQSALYDTGLEAGRLLSTAEVLEFATTAKEQGATRLCMGAAWRGVREGTAAFEAVLDIVRAVSQLGLEVCVTLGELTATAARQLREAGVTSYNHNLDTSPEFYPQIVTTHSYADRLRTIQHVQAAGIQLCCGGIIGMGESVEDRLRLLQIIANFDPPPESVPINCLMAVPGTPLEQQPALAVFELVRLIATARIVVPRAKVRLSAGRTGLSREAQALCIFAGANSIFFGNKLLTAANPEQDEDHELLAELGLVGQPPRPCPGAGVSR